MSAFMCSDNLISLIANAVGGEAAEKNAAFKLLVAANVRSLQHRYPHYPDMWDGVDEAERRDDPANKIIAEAMAELPPHVLKYKYKGELTVRVLMTQLVKVCDCYDYQACETDDYEQSEAAKLVAKVRAKAIKAGGQKSGPLYDQLIWGLD